jgi:hypothetical protein
VKYPKPIRIFEIVDRIWIKEIGKIVRAKHALSDVEGAQGAPSFGEIITSLFFLGACRLGREKRAES